MEAELNPINPYTDRPYTEEDKDALALISAASMIFMQVTCESPEDHIRTFQMCDNAWTLVEVIGGVERLRGALGRFAKWHNVGNPLEGNDPPVPETPA